MRRISRFGRVQEVECREAGRASSVEAGRRQEAARLREHLPAGTVAIALDRGGQAWSSEAFARQLDVWRTGAKPVAFVVGGSHGLDPGLLEACDRRWSLGPLTLPHELARVLVYEQLYRGLSILHGTPYHK